MSKLFYDHLIVIEEINNTLVALELPEEDYNETLSIIDETVHHHVLDVILTHLPNEHHETFLEQLASAPHDKSILIFLNEKSPVDIEEEIAKTIDKLKEELLELILQQ